MVALLAALVLAVPPKATLTTGSSHVPLAISSWCWAARCGAPFAASRKPGSATKGALVVVELAFLPRHARLAVGGRPVTVTIHGHAVEWTAQRGGGLTLHVTGARGWVTYVGRLRLR